MSRLDVPVFIHTSTIEVAGCSTTGDHQDGHEEEHHEYGMVLSIPIQQEACRGRLCWKLMGGL